MREPEVVWLLVLFPWLAQGQLGQTSTRSPTPGTGTCPKGYAWEEHVRDCIPCSICISYPLSQFCSACPEFIYNESTTNTSGPDSEVDLETSDTGVNKGDNYALVARLIAVSSSLLFIIVASILALRILKAKRKKEKARRKNLLTRQPPQNTHDHDRDPEIMIPWQQYDHATTSNSTFVTVTPPRPWPSLPSYSKNGNLELNDNHSIITTVTQMPLKKSVHFVPNRHISDSDSDISSMSRTQPGSSPADSGYSTSRTASASCVINMPRWKEESYDESGDSVCSESNIATSGCNSAVSSAEALIGKDGGILMLPNAATSLLFSPHSISNQIDITLEILHNQVALPDLREDETLVSPFVFCGPHGWTFHKPVLLTFPHCGMSDRDDFTLLVSETSSQQAPDWMEVSSATPGIEYFVRESECLVYTCHFTGFSVKSKGPKQVRLLAFRSISNNLYRLRVYCINDTKDVIDRITEEEQKYGFRSTDRGIPMTFLNNKKDLHLKAHLETPDWKFLGSSELVISYESVRGNRDGNVLFNLQAEAELKRDKLIIPLSIKAFQEGNTDSPTYRVAEELTVGQTETLSKLSPTSHQTCDHKGACNCRTPSQVYMVHTDAKEQPRMSFLNSLRSHRNLTIPHKLRTQLCIKLDPKKDRGDDWRSLASVLGLDEFIEYIDSKGNPTEMVLQEFDKSGKTLKDLRAILIGIGRQDAASLVQEHLQTTNCDMPPPFNDSGVGSPDTDASEKETSVSPAFDKRFFPNSPSQAEERNPPQYNLPCGDSIPSHELYNSRARTETSETSSTPSDKRFFPNGPSRAEERNPPQYVHRGESVPSHELYDSCQDSTEPKLTQAIESMQDLALNSTASDSDESGNVETQEVNGSSTGNSVVSVVVSIPGPEVERFPKGFRETQV